MDFWESALLRTDGECIFHMILPTIMTTVHASWERIKTSIDPSDALMMRAQRENLLCSYCKRDVQLEVVRLAVRILISRDESNRYRCAFGSACVCNRCNNVDAIAFDSDTPMHEALFERMENFGREVAYLNAHRKIDGLEFMRQLMEAFHGDYASFIRQLRKLETKKCYHCKKTPRKLSYCSGCYYMRYCDAKCQNADWKKHKSECKFLTTHSIFFDPSKAGKRYK